MRLDQLPVRLGPYTLVSLLGVGGMARVYRAVREGPMGFRKELAVKLIRAGDNPGSPSLTKYLINEARLGGQLRHPNVVDTYEFGAVGDEHYIAMELVDGLTLHTLLSGLARRGSRLPLTAVLHLAIQVSQGLDYAHALASPEGQPLNLIHRDLKPANIIVTMAGQAKIMDFGIARSDAALSESTSADAVKGTLKYMSPEQIKTPASLDRRSDLFSLGSILFECVVGEPLVQGTTVGEVMGSLVMGGYTSRLEQLGEVCPKLLPILTQCLEEDREDRYPSASALQEDLAELKLDLGGGHGCEMFMALCQAHTNGDSAELQRLQTKLQQHVQRVGRDTDWTVMVERMVAEIGSVTDDPAASISHSQQVPAGSTEVATENPATELGEVIVVWQAEDAPGAIATDDGGTTRAFTEFDEASTADVPPETASTEPVLTPPPQTPMDSSAATVAHAEQRVVGVGGDVSESTPEIQPPASMAAAAAHADPGKPQSRFQPSFSVLGLATVGGVLVACIAALAVWQPWRSEPRDEVAAGEALKETSTAIEDIPVSDQETAVAPPVEALTAHEELATPHPETVQPPTPRTETPVNTAPAKAALTEESSAAASDTPVRVFVNADPWATWTLTGSLTGSGDCPHIEDLPPGTYHFLLEVPGTDDTHTVTVQVQGDEVEIKRCWSFTKNGPC